MFNQIKQKIKVNFQNRLKEREKFEYEHPPRLAEEAMELQKVNFKLSEEERRFRKVVEHNNTQEIDRLKRDNARLQEDLKRIIGAHKEEMNSINRQNQRLIWYETEYRKQKIQIKEKDQVIKNQNAVIKSQI